MMMIIVHIIDAAFIVKHLLIHLKRARKESLGMYVESNSRN